uniref:ABC transporter domain-containing protein n=1 Tax=Mesocestoides corti TaxID=53468 RepID=A0A5K3FK94_MESCO
MSTSIGGGLGLSEAFIYILIAVMYYYGIVLLTRKESNPGDIVLNNFSLNIKPGQTIALVGASGSGKSTVIQLIQRFYDANDGQIIIDGEDIRNLDLAWFRSQLGVVSQEPVLFAGTVTENIKLGALNASQEEVEEAAKLACVHDFVCKLPEAYNTFIAEGGGAMSGGQKQRLAIARALIRKPRILLLDEATSALDTKSEKSVQRALDNAKVGRTVVVVAHRLSTVRDADTIVVVNKGQVVEMGTHDQLMAIKDGQYASLVKTSHENEASKESPGMDEEEDDDDDDVAKVIAAAETKVRLFAPDLNHKTSDLKKDVTSLYLKPFQGRNSLSYNYRCSWF